MLVSSSTEAAVWYEPPVASANECSWAVFAGTSCRPYGGMSTVPSGVPKAIVDTAILAVLAAVSASVSVRPVLLDPSLSSTIRAGAAFDPLGVVDLENVDIASRHENTALPMAVCSPSCRPSTAILKLSRSMVGDTLTSALPENATSPRLILGGNRSANVS